MRHTGVIFAEPGILGVLFTESPQYEAMSLAQAKRKVGQLPRGTTLVFDDLGIEGDAADRVFEALCSVAAEHGITISRAPRQ